MRTSPLFLALLLAVDLAHAEVDSGALEGRKKQAMARKQKAVAEVLKAEEEEAKLHADGLEIERQRANVALLESEIEELEKTAASKQQELSAAKVALGRVLSCR